MEGIDKTILNRALNGLLEGLGEAKDFALEQAPDVIHQLLAYKLVSNVIGLSIWGLIFLTCVIAFAILLPRTQKDEVKNRKEFNELDYTKREAAGFSYSCLYSLRSCYMPIRVACVITGIGIIPAFLGMLCFIDPIVKLWVAPKIYLLESVRGLML